MSVFAAIQEVRHFPDIPIIVIVESDGDLVKSLELGADDYIRLPCNLMEVMARAVATLRRSGMSRGCEQHPMRFGDLLVNPATYEVFLGSRRILLTPTEFKLLYVLTTNRHMTVPADYMHRLVWPYDSEAGVSVKKYVQRLRHKLGDDAKNPVWIKTVHGVGYSFNAPL